MRLPNGENAYVAPEKIEGYLLNQTHVVGSPKARYFARLGFTLSSALLFRDALLSIARSGRVVGMTDGPYGKKFVVEGVLRSIAENEMQSLIRTVWMVPKSEAVPCLITAYPVRKE